MTPLLGSETLPPDPLTSPDPKTHANVCRGQKNPRGVNFRVQGRSLKIPGVGRSPKQPKRHQKRGHFLACSPKTTYDNHRSNRGRSPGGLKNPRGGQISGPREGSPKIPGGVEAQNGPKRAEKVVNFLASGPKRPKIDPKRCSGVNLA